MSILQIFPTQVGLYTFPESDRIQLPDSSIFFTNDISNSSSLHKEYHGQSLLEEQSFSYLANFILESSRHFLVNTFGCTNQIFISNSWLNVGNAVSTQDLHNHSNSTISGTFYLSFDPASHPGIVFKNPRSTGSFSFVEDFPILSTPFNSSFYKPSYNELDLLLWPSYLDHGFFPLLNPSSSHKDRISLSFNIGIERTLLHPYKVTCS